MPPGITFYDNNVGLPEWLKSFGGRDHMAEFPARLNPDEFLDDAGIRLKVTADALPGTNEVQTITMDANAGNWTIGVTGTDDVSGNLAYNVSTAALQAAIAALIGPGKVRVSGTAGTSYALTYIGELAETNIANNFFTVTDVSLTGGTAGTVSIAQTTAGAAGASTLAVVALTQAIPKNSLIPFGPGIYVQLSAQANKGADSVSIKPLSAPVLTGDLGVYSPHNRKTIFAGRLCGRTYAEQAASDPFGKADVENDDEIYLSIFTIPNALENADVEFVRHGQTIVLDRLPGYSEFTAAEIAWLRANYTCITAAGG